MMYVRNYLRCYYVHLLFNYLVIVDFLWNQLVSRKNGKMDPNARSKITIDRGGGGKENRS